MGKFNPIKTDGAEVSIELFNRLQQAIQLAFEPGQDTGIAVRSATGEDRPTDKDEVIIADPVGGPVRVILPVPSRRQIITVLNGSGTSNNPVTVSRIDGKTMGESGTSLVVDKLKVLSVVCDSKDWFPMIPGG